MNPSTQEIISAFEDLPAEDVIILPNNKNILLAAQQAVKISDKNVTVVPSVSVPQGIAAMFAYEQNGGLKEVTENMTASLDDIQTVQITTATRSVEIDEVQVKEGQVIGLLENHLVASGDNIADVLLDTLEKAQLEDVELITLYYGQNYSEEEANRIVEVLQSKYGELEMEVHAGGQPHYQLILSLE